MQRLLIFEVTDFAAGACKDNWLVWLRALLAEEELNLMQLNCIVQERWVVLNFQHKPLVHGSRRLVAARTMVAGQIWQS